MNADGTMLISEYNWTTKGQFNTYTLSQSATTRGQHTVLGYIYLIDNGGGGSSGSSNNPTGWVDIVSGGAGFVRVRGWAFDADDMSAQLNIHVYIGDDEGHGWLYANQERPDVNKNYGCGNYHGFDEIIQTDKTGTHTVSIYAINVGGGGNVLLKQETVNISPAPTYSLDINTVIDGTTYMSGKSGFTFDLYLNGSLVADDAIDYANFVRGGTTYEVKDIRCPNGYAYAGGTYSGTVNENMDIRPNFSSNIYTVSLISFSESGDSSKTVTYGGTYGTLPTPTRYGWVFDGWYTSPTGGSKVTSSTKVTTIGNHTLYAHWKTQSLYFDVNHDAINPNRFWPVFGNSNKCSFDNNTQVLTINGTFNDDAILGLFNFPVSGGDVYKLTATILSGSTTNGFLVFDGIDSGICRMYDEKYGGTRLNLDVTSSRTVTWTITNKQATGLSLLEMWVWGQDDKPCIFNNLKLKIKVEKVASSSAKTTGYSPAAQVIKTGATYGTLPTPTRAGYTFDGWYTSATGGTKITSSTKVTATGNQTLYAHWTCNHSYTSQIVTAATCCSTGTKKYTCKTCGNTYTETIAKNANNHTGGTELKNAKTATCGEAGYTGDTCCKGCSAVITKGSAIPATGSHSYNSQIVKQATCNSTGTKKYTCKTCGNTYTETIAKNANNHTGGTELKNAKNATCTEAGYTGNTCCKGCSVVLTKGSVIPATGNHSFGAWKQTKAPTCTAKGEKTRTCSVCGKMETLAVDKIAHTYTATVTEATCTEDGKTVYTCSCGDTYTEGIPAKGHHDEDVDGKCDACGLAMSNISADCSCRCHKTGLNKFIYKIILIFWKLFRINKTCACGVAHY